MPPPGIGRSGHPASSAFQQPLAFVVRLRPGHVWKIVPGRDCRITTYLGQLVAVKNKAPDLERRGFVANSPLFFIARL